MEVTYRPARLEDLEPATRLVTEAYNDLRSHHGLAPTISSRPPLFQRFCFIENPDGFWVAEEDGQLVGSTLGGTQTLAWASSYYLTAIFADPVSRELGLSQTWFFGAVSAALLLSAWSAPMPGG